MVSSMLLAKIFGLYMLIVGIGMFMNQKYYQSTINNILQDNPLLLLSGIITLILGLILISVHNVWVEHWYVVITILCWITFLKGVVRVVFPKFAHKKQQLWMNKPSCYTFSYGLAIIVGAYLTYMAFFPHHMMHTM